MKVLWLANIPSPYRVNFFNELGKNCELTVLFEKQASSERDDSWKKFHTRYFNAIFLQGKSVGTAEAFCPSIIKYLNKDYDHIVVTTFSDPTGMLAITYMRFRKIPYEIESDGAFPGSKSGMKNKIKTFLLSGAERYFSTAKLHDEYYRQYGANEEKLVRYPFTSVYDRDILKETLSSEEKKSFRKELRMNEEHIVLAVGQFIPRKGYDTLLRAVAKLDKAFGIYIVGGEAPEEYIVQKKQLNLENVHFVNFKQPDELKKFYMAADVFVHPTREDIWGLVINEAMAYGLPVVTTDRCIAGLEMVREKENGYIVKVGDIDNLVKAIYGCADIVDKKISLKVAKEFTIEKMVQAHFLSWNFPEN